MQQAQQREIPERISWARAMIFAVGFFFIAALLIGQIPSYIFLQMTASSLVGLEQGFLALGLICVASFVIVQVIVLLFDPKPLIPPLVFTILGLLIGVAGLAILLGSTWTGNQYFPGANTSWNPVLGGKVLWFPPGSVDFAMLGSAVLAVGIGMIFYGVLAMREQRNPDRSDPGTTPTVRGMIIAGTVMLAAFMVFYTLVNDNGLAAQLGISQLIVDSILNAFLGIAVLLTIGAFALRLHYLMRPLRKRTMAPLYLIGANLLPIGLIFLLFWFVAYPLIDWIHSWTLIGLGDYLTVCARKSAIPQSCAFSAQAGYIVAAIVTTNNFVVLMGAVWAWKTRRNLVVIGGITITTVLALATFITHTAPDKSQVALLLCGGALILAAIWTSTARREFAVVGERNLGCIGMWLVLGTCLLIYLAAFAFFSIPVWPPETEPNIPFVSGLLVPPHGASETGPDPTAIEMFVIMAILAGIHFYFLVRTRYKV